MLQAKPQFLLPESQDRFNRYLAQKELQTLISIVEGKATEQELKALQDMGESGAYPKKLDTSHASLQDAYRYRHFLEVLNEIVTKPKHQTITVTYASPS